MKALEDIPVPEYREPPATPRQRALLVRRLQRLHQLAEQLAEVGTHIDVNGERVRVQFPDAVVIVDARRSYPSEIDDGQVYWPIDYHHPHDFSPRDYRVDEYLHIEFLQDTIFTDDPRLPDFFLALCLDRHDVTSTIRNVSRCIKVAEHTLSEIALLALKETA